MADNPRSRGSRQKVRQWCHEVFDSMSKLDETDMFGFAEKALQDAGHDSARQTLVELSAGAGTPGITAALITAAVRNGSTQLSRAAADLLIDIKNPESAKSIIKECLESGDSAIRVRAIEALEAFDAPWVFDLLLQALTSDDDNVSRAAVNSFGLVIGGKYHPLKSQLLRALSDTGSELFALVTETGDIALKREFAKVLGFADSDDVLPLLEALAREPDTQTRREAVLALAANGSSAAIDIVEQKLDDHDEMVVTFALDALASEVGRDSEHMLKCIRKVIEHRNESVRRNAVMMLNWFPWSRIEDLLREAVKDPDFEVQRSAQSLLRTMDSNLAPIGLDATGAGERGEDTLKIWEAGNVGMEAGQAESKSTVDAQTTVTDAIVTELEKQAASGDISRRNHAITELIELEDITDSPVLRKALYEESESIRTRAAKGLDFTRDAGLATQALVNHPDALVRRRAVDALAENPSERTKGDRGRSKGVTTFASERSQGMELFSCFLKALDDRDEGVVQSACYAIGHYPEFNCPIPVRETIEKLQDLEANEMLSSLTRDNAADLIDDINDAKMGEPLVNALNAALSGLEDVKGAAALLSWDADKEAFSFGENTEDATQTGAKLAREWGIEPESAYRIAESAVKGEALEENLAAAYAETVCRSAGTIFEAVARSAQALAEVGESGWTEQLENWRGELDKFPEELFETNPAFRKQGEDAQKALTDAKINTRAAIGRLNGDLKPDMLEDFLNSENDRDRMMALTALRNAGAGKDEELLRSLVDKFREEPGCDRALGAAALELVRGADEFGLEVLAEVLERCRPALLADLMHGLIGAAQHGKNRELIKKGIDKSSFGPLAAVCMKIAAVAGGGSEDIEKGRGADDAESMMCHYAHKALRAMDNEEKAAEELKDTLRSDEQEERELAAGFLGLARVESAISVYAGVSDQVDSPWRLRTLCGGLMVRNGHRQGMGWFNKSAGHGNAENRGLTALDLARAIVDVIPLMLRCNEVNVGRFV